MSHDETHNIKEHKVYIKKSGWSNYKKKNKPNNVEQGTRVSTLVLVFSRLVFISLSLFESALKGFDLETESAVRGVEGVSIV